MSTRLVTGLLLAVLFVRPLAAQEMQEPQWLLPATTLAPRSVEQRSLAAPIGVMLGDAVPVQQANFSSMDDATPPRPLPSAQGSLTPAPQIVPAPASQQSIVGDIPIMPTEIVGGRTTISNSSCNCGAGAVVGGTLLGNAVVVDGGCGDCCGCSGCCSDCCPDSCLGKVWNWLTSWHDSYGLSCCDCCNNCCYDSNRTRFWFTAEYLLWQFSKPNLPPLVTTGGVGPVVNGVNTGPALGQSGTTVLVGPDSFDGSRSGMRFDAGFWFSSFGDKLGIDFSVLYFPLIQDRIVESSGVLGRPFLNVTPGTTPYQTTEAVNGFNGTTGSVAVDYWNRVWGFDANLRYKLCCCPNFRIDLLAGYRNFNLQEGLSVNENLNFGGGVTNQITDAYNANNAFNGGQIGIDAEWRFLSRWSLGGQFKLALGDVHESVNISGSTVPFAGAPAPVGVGFFAANTNIGNYSRDQFAVLPEFNFRIGFDITKNVRLFVSYDLLYLSSAVRVGDTIDTTINTNNNQLFGAPGNPSRPSYSFGSSSFLAQGFTGGIDIHW